VLAEHGLTPPKGFAYCIKPAAASRVSAVPLMSAAISGRAPA
jgi:hypothetical protein